MELARPTFVDHVYNFNLITGLLHDSYDEKKGYVYALDDYREASFAIEEALEGFDMQRLAHFVHSDSLKPRDVARTIVGICRDSQSGMHPTILTDVERLDKACDAVVFAIGYMAKLRLSPDQINRAMCVVTDANLQKLTMPKDAQGKLMKNPDFIGPEARLQLILDEREPEKC